MNKETAIATNELNSQNQITPYGRLSYKQIGTWADGTPRFEATTELNPEQQGIFNLTQQTQKNLGQIGVDQSDKIREILNSPFDFNSAIGTQQSDMSRKLLDPVWNQREEALRTRLANQGISEGSQAWTNATRDFGSQRDNSYISALLSSRGQAAQEALTNRNQPLNEIAALLSSSQIQQPNFVNTPTNNIANTDYMGAAYNSFAGQQNNYNQKMQQQNAMLGGLFGMTGAGLGGWAGRGFTMSDRRLKEDIKRVGETESGIPIYTFRYKGLPVTFMGVMADEVEKIIPESVIDVGGFKAVDYSRI